MEESCRTKMNCCHLDSNKKKRAGCNKLAKENATTTTTTNNNNNNNTNTTTTTTTNNNNNDNDNDDDDNKEGGGGEYFQSLDFMSFFLLSHSTPVCVARRKEG